MFMDVRAKKKFGQHFLCDEEIAKRIADSIGRNLPILEIGAGTGVLTKFFLEQEDFISMDIDPDMLQLLKGKFPGSAAKFVQADFLNWKAERFFKGEFNIIGNFPYNISSQIMFKVLEMRNCVQEVVGMFQREVATRLSSGHGTKDYGILSVLLQVWYDAEYLFSVDSTAFSPPPKVQSGVVRFRRKASLREDCNEAALKQVVKSAFNQRRKMLRNSLSGIFHPDIMSGNEIFTRRPEQVSVEEFIELSKLAEAAKRDRK